jgi:DNA processing protein
MATTFDLLTLALVPGLSSRTSRALLERAPLAEVLARPEEHADLVPGPALESLRSGDARRRAEAEMRRTRALGVQVVGRDEGGYPQRLRQIFDPPLVLFVRGRLEAGDDGAQTLSIVGARAATGLGRAFARELAASLAAEGLSVVSGLARGIDAAAHEGALDAGGRTVAVLGSGLDRLYPPEHEPLAAAIANRGAVVTEFPLGTGPRKGHFPRRNRLIAGWGRAVVVVEAGARSGALVTARLALDEGREVMAVPGHPSEPGAEGSNALLRDGAALVRGPADVLAELGLEPHPPSRARSRDEVLSVLSPGRPMGIDEIRSSCGAALSEVLTRLSELELRSAVRRLPGGLFVRS